MFQFITIAKVREDAIEDIKAAAEVMAAATRAQQGNVEYNLLQRADDPTTLIVAECWETEADFERHVAHPDDPADPLYAFGQVMNPALESEPTMIPCVQVV